jgi:hypothetical protein
MKWIGVFSSSDGQNFGMNLHLREEDSPFTSTAAIFTIIIAAAATKKNFVDDLRCRTLPQ